MRISVTPVSGSPARIVAGIGAAPRMPRQQRRVEVERAVRQVEQRRRDDLPVVREDDERPGRRREDRRDRLRMRAAAPG